VGTACLVPADSGTIRLTALRSQDGKRFQQLEFHTDVVKVLVQSKIPEIAQESDYALKDRGKPISGRGHSAKSPVEISDLPSPLFDVYCRFVCKGQILRDARQLQRSSIYSMG
jgi:hypothetical protein